MTKLERLRRLIARRTSANARRRASLWTRGLDVEAYAAATADLTRLAHEPRY